MEKQILEQLTILEKEKNITILLAIESGSRAWGFPSPDSDYDVRIFYAHQKDWYLSISDRKDTIDYFHGELLDIGGWDIRKTLKLLYKSNASIFEWLQSPIVYYKNEVFHNQMTELSNQFFQAKHTLNHYKGIAHNSIKGLNDFGEIKLKKLFYVLRPILAAKWIIRNQTIPPMEIQSLLHLVENKIILTKIEALIVLKNKVGESYTHSIESDLLTYIEQQFELLNTHQFEADSSIPDKNILDTFFRKIINSK